MDALLSQRVTVRVGPACQDRQGQAQLMIFAFHVHQLSVNEGKLSS